VTNLEESLSSLYCSDDIYCPIEDLHTADLFIRDLKQQLPGGVQVFDIVMLPKSRLLGDGDIERTQEEGKEWGSD
jgi:hypothetical protein